jgi:PAS domain S-box-containing protein
MLTLFTGALAAQRRPGQPEPARRSYRRLRAAAPYVYALAGPFVVKGLLGLVSARVTQGEAGEAFYLVPVALAAYVGGLRAGMLATAVSAVVGAYHVFDLPGLAPGPDPLLPVELGIVVALGATLTVLFAWARDARDRARIERTHVETILESVGDAVITIDAGGRIGYANRAAGALAGIAPEALIGRSADEALPRSPRTTPPGRESADDGRRDDAHGFGGGCARRVTLQAADGRRIPVMETASSLIGATDDAVEATVLVMSDETAQVQAEDALRDQLRLREDLAHAVQSAPGIVYAFRLAPDGRMSVPYASPGIRDIFSTDLEELAHTADPIFTHVAREDRDRLIADIHTSAATMTPWKGEFRVRRPDGSYRWVEGGSVPVRDVDGGITWRGIITDVTSRKEAELARREAAEALAVSERRYRALVELSPDAIFVSHDMRITFANPAALKLLHATSEADVVGQPSVAFTHPDDVAALQRAEDRLHAGDLLPPAVWRVRCCDGSILEAEAIARVVHDAEGEGTLVMMRDLSERRALEQQVRTTQKLESIGLLAGGVAHDFNNWLTVINANCDALRGMVATDAEAIGLVDEVRNAGDRAASLTRQLLAFSRRQVVAPKVLDLNLVIADTEKMLRRVLGEDITVSVALRATRAVKVDPGQLTQVLMNLAVNARDAMPVGGALTVGTADLDTGASTAVRFPTLRAGRYVAITVRDTGVGMPADVAARVFEPFFTTKGVGKGTGLGLSVVHGIVAGAGGAIAVESVPGVGTAFTVVLPESTEAPQAAEAGAPRPLTGTERVLLVEDEVLVRRTAARALRSAGYQVLEAVTGEDAVRIVGDGAVPIDLMLTDVVMPGIDGGVLAELALRARPNLRVLYASGYTDDAVLRHGVQYEEVPFLHKPYNVVQLLTAVRDVLDGTRDPVATTSR